MAAPIDEVSLNDGMFFVRQLLHGAGGEHMALTEHSHSVGHLPEQVNVVGDHHHRLAGLAVGIEDEIAHASGAGWIQARGGFVEEQQLGVERHRAGQAGALEHAATELVGQLYAGIGWQPRQGQLAVGQAIDQRIVELAVFAQRQAHVLAHGQRAEQAAVLEHHAPTQAQATRLRRIERGDVLAEQADAAGRGPLKQDHLAQQHRLARAAAAHNRQDFALLHGEAEVFVHGVAAKARAQTLHLDHGR